MKKILFLLLVTISSYAQTYQNPTFGTVKSMTAPTVSTTPTLGTIEANGTISKIVPNNVPITYTPINYAPSSTSIADQLAGIDTRLGQIGNVTAGVTTRVHLTGDNITVTAGTFFASNTTGKGATAAGTPQQTLSNNDDQKQYFTKDVMSIAVPALTTAPPGVYSGQLTVTSDPTPGTSKQRFTIEIYKCNNGGTPIASGITGAPVGDLGVTVVAILDSGLINVVAAALTNIGVQGNLASTLTLNTGERLRYHVSAEKVGTDGGSVTMNVYYGTNYNSYYDIPVTFRASTVLNDSGVSGQTVANALDNLNAKIPTTYSKVVYVNNVNPNIATIFDLNNPPTVNDNALKTDVNNLYIGTDASTWVYNSTSLNYVTKTVTSATSNFYLSGTTTDAGNTKTGAISRLGTIESSGFIRTGTTSTNALLAGGGSLANPISGTGVTNQISYWNSTNSQVGHAGLMYDSANSKMTVTTARIGTGIEIGGNRNAIAQTSGIWLRGLSSELQSQFYTSTSGNSQGQLFNTYYDQSATGFFQTVNGNSFLLGGGYFRFQGNGQNFQWAVTPPYANGSGLDTSTTLTNIMTLSKAGALVLTGSATATSLILSTTPTTSAGSYHFLTGNSSTGVTEKILSTTIQPTITATTSADYYRGDKTFQPLNSAVIGSVLTGYTSGAGTVSSTDTVLQAIQKLNGNDALKATDASALHKTGGLNELFDGIKSANNTGNSIINGFTLTNSGTFGSRVINGVSNSSGDFMRVDVSSSGRAIFVNNSSSTAAVSVSNISGSAGVSFLANAEATSTGNFFEGRNILTTTFSVDKLGLVSGTSFVATSGTIRLKNYTVATLPAGVQGDTAYVTDATAPTYLGTLTGGGSVVCPVFYNGTAWVSH